MLNVVILYNLFERLQKGEEKDILAEGAIVEEIEAVESAVRSLGHHSVVMAVREEIFPIIHWLKECQPDVVFNLCESVYGNSCWEMNIPALLDLFRVPYTGSSALTLGLCLLTARASASARKGQRTSLASTGRRRMCLTTWRSCTVGLRRR